MTTAAAPASSPLQQIPLAQLHESPLNPRKKFDPIGLTELAASIGRSGIITPLVARPRKNGGYELAAGHRRFRAAAIAKLETVPVITRTMDDAEFVEVLNVENLQRQDIHPLEEAQGFQDLITIARLDVEKIADRVAKSVKYVYDRIKLLQLIPDAKKLFLEDRFTAGHAILLARLAKSDQERAIDPDAAERSHDVGGLWQHDVGWQDGPGLFASDDKSRKGKTDPYLELKPVSVREFESWISDHVRLDPTRDTDPMLFPEIAKVVVPVIGQKGVKLIPITHEHRVADDARSEERTYGAGSWKRADGLLGSKTCAFSGVGFVAAGEGKGQAFNVCVRRDKCEIHWPAEVKAARKREAEKKVEAAKAPASSAKAPSAAEKEKLEREAAKAAEEQAREELNAKRWKKARPELVKRLVAHIKKASAARSGVLGKYLLSALSDGSYGGEIYLNRDDVKRANTHITGTSADDVVRWIVVGHALGDIDTDHCDLTDAIDFGKEFGFDLQKELDAVAPLPKPAPVKAAAKPTKKPVAKKSAKKKSR